jgi:hypothetical protein
VGWRGRDGAGNVGVEWWHVVVMTFFFFFFFFFFLDTKVVESPALRVSYDASRENDGMW